MEEFKISQEDKDEVLAQVNKLLDNEEGYLVVVTPTDDSTKLGKTFENTELSVGVSSQVRVQALFGAYQKMNDSDKMLFSFLAFKDIGGDMESLEEVAADEEATTDDLN